MRVWKSHPLTSLVNDYLVDSPQPANLSYLWNFGSLLGFCLVIQIITGVTLAMHYNPSVLEAFNSVEHIMRDVNNGWLIRYLHSNTASAFFFLVYLHVGRGLYYGSYRAPRTLTWALGTIILVLMMATAFLGYVLPYGQMSLWGATVITNLLSAIPWVGKDIVEFVWGGFSVNNATLNRFFALHFVLPFVLAALVIMHLIALHAGSGSGNPLGVSGNYDKLPFAPYFVFKDLITIFLFIIGLSVFVFFMPNVLGDSENYVMANPMQTPPAIVPEWYLLPFYAILRSIPNKLLGVIAMFSAILIILIMPFTDLGKSRGLQFRPLGKIVFYIFLANFLILMQLGAKHVESPFIEFGQISTLLYFSHFLIIVPLISLFENSLMDVATTNNKNSSYKTNSSLNSVFGISFKRHYSTKRTVVVVKVSFFSKIKAKFTDLRVILSILITVSIGFVSRLILLNYFGIDVVRDIFSFISATYFTMLAIFKVIVDCYLEHMGFGVLTLNMDGNTPSQAGNNTPQTGDNAPQAGSSGSQKGRDSPDFSEHPGHEPTDPSVTVNDYRKPINHPYHLGFDPTKPINPPRFPGFDRINNWGYPNQGYNWPITVHDWEGFVPRGYIPGGDNQPVIANLGWALEHRAFIGRTHLSGDMFNSDLRQFMLDHLFHTNKPLYDRVVAIPGFVKGERFPPSGGVHPWLQQYKVANDKEFRNNFV